jgi:hypothetical protein
MRSWSASVLVVLALPVLPALSGCGLGSSPFDADRDPIDPSACSGLAPRSEEPETSIRSFGSEAELSAYIGAIDAANKAEQERLAKCRRASGSAGGGDAGVAAAADNGSAPPSAPSADNETITNNQEAGVDEGGIVKNVGGALVVLRQGRLYVVDVAGGAPTLVDSMRVARSDALNQGVWYDEMLVKGDLVYVVGYRYSVPGAPSSDGIRGATEIDSFRIAGGKLQRLQSMFLESNDYYSGKNYASRMTGGKLVFYMPHFVGRTDTALAYPRLLEMGDDGVARVKGPIFGALDVSTSLVKPRWPTFHTVVQCDLPATGELACRAKSVLGSYWREHYVTGDAVYLWASSHVYRFDFATLDVTAHRAEGYPIDPFSFRAGDGELFVAATTTSPSERQRASIPALLRLPLAAFDKTGAQASIPSVKLADSGSVLRNRFVGDVLVAGVGTGSYWAPTGSGELVAYDAKANTVSRRPIQNLVRLEPIGERRVLAVTQSADSRTLTLEALGTGDLAASLGKVSIQGAQGESRSHGFFYKPGAEGAGTFGYAVINPRGYGASNGWGNGISNIGFFRVASAGALSEIGIVSAGTTATQCETSCVDWYGNTRPIFLGTRTFALMGSELVEVFLDAGVRRGQAAELRFDERL